MSLPIPSLPVPASLPTPTTPLIGRERALADVVAAIQADTTRLLTLTGAGGIGKTRLAIAVAQQCAPSFADEVIYVPLAAIRDAGLVPSAVAGALGLRFADAQPGAAQVVAELQHRHALLVLDNMEQVIDAAPFVAELVARCPRMTLLVTSRAILNLAVEHRYTVPPLALPAAPTLETLATSPAVALLMERARAVRPDLQLTAEHASTVADICNRLEGLPLAIELAAARLNLLSLPALQERLTSRLNLLTSGPRDLPPHQQTLRKTIGWSYDLLLPDEQHLYALLGVFAGGWTLEAAEMIWQVAGSSSTDLLDLLSSLLDKSMIIRADSGAGRPRFAMLEAIREYALEQLRAARLDDTARQHHAAFFTRLCEQAEPHLTGPAQREWLDALDEEHANIRAALAYAAERSAVLPLAQISSAIWRFWHVHGHVQEGRGWLMQAIAHGAQVPAALRARVQTSAGWLANVQGDLSAAEQHFAQALEDAQSAADQDAIGQALGGLGRMAHLHGNAERAARLYEESLRLLRAASNRQEVAWTLVRMGILALERAQYPQAHALFVESSTAFAALGFGWGQTSAQTYLGDTAQAQGDAPEAARCYHAALRSFEQLGDRESAEAVQQRLAPALPTAPAAPALPHPDALTPRERDVARYVATGMTDQQVAQTLHISPRTVHAHLRSIYAKCGVSTRSAITRLVIEQRLLEE